MTSFRRYPTIGAACLIVLASGRTSAQTNTASVSGTVRTAAGAALSDATVVAGRRLARTDSLGRYQLDSLAEGASRVIVRRFGFVQVDSTLNVRAGERLRWDVALRESEIFKDYERKAAAANAQNAASGHIDSIAEKLIRPNADRVLPLGAFGARFVSTMVAKRGVDSNTVLSPVSAGMALSLARFGARGKTAEAFDRTLAFGLDPATVEARGAEMMTALSRRTDVTLEMANAIWVDTAAVPMPSFRESTSRWRATMASMPLASSRTAEAINHWVDSVTHGKIPNILNDSLPDTTRLFIANAVYFKGRWLVPFEKSETKPGDFRLPSGKRITVPRMSRVDDVEYRRESGYQVIRLPYRTGKVAMYIVLPDRDVKFDAVARRLAAGDLVPSGGSFERRTVHVALPRFHSELTLNLVEPLKALGLGIAFDCYHADFTGMARAANPQDSMPLCIGSAVQKVYIDVDEEGTEAAAVTGLGMMTITSLPPPPIEFVVDRPFLFVLRDEVTGTDLFVGRIARP